MSEQFKHEALVENRFKKSFRNIDSEHKKLIFEKMKRLLNNEIQGEYLKYPYKGLKKVRVGKYRIIYSERARYSQGKFFFDKFWIQEGDPGIPFAKNL